MRMRKPVSRACDACRRRKIKCTGCQPCPACSTSSLICTFRHEQRKGGNQGARATVLNALRNSAHSETSPNELSSPTNGEAWRERRDTDFLPSDLVNRCIEAYFHHLYPVVPFLTRDLLEHEANTLQTSQTVESRIFITAFCAYVVTFGPASSSSLAAYESNSSTTTLGQYLLDRTLSILPADRASSPSFQAVSISFFLYGAFAGLGNYRQGWFYLREAATLFMMCDRVADKLYSAKVVRRLFWVLLISER